MKIRQLFNIIEPELQKVDDYLVKSFEDTHERLRCGFMHLLKAGGKRMRPAFTILASRYGNGDSEKIIPLAAALEMVHMASLIHDDVIDSSDTRRGEPTIRRLFGNEYSLYLGDFLFATALSIIDGYKNHEINNLLAVASMEMCRGEIEEIASSYQWQQNMRNYLYRIKRKTSLLITLSCQAGALAAGAEPQVVKALGRYGHNIGMAFQITDDVLDFVADEKTLGKPVGADLLQGVMTLPLIYIFRYGETSVKQEIKKALEQESLSREDVLEVIRIVAGTKAVDYSLGIANKFVEKALRQLEELPDNSTTATLRKIGQFIYNREY
ncbi:MAG: polyprenyl synthetase family protein [Peptococcaceae bacterium]|jgi:heptaprenyl diphosphate synthase|nr:polyprenyl synthetase family protein [Peptococcaceae bacterium]MDH7525246.1 polyprenyl synthetase family protein [Peptococcaceae bacterium]